MKILDEIIAGVTDKSEAISDTLRRCLILAYKLKNDALKAWVEKELNGYTGDDELPEYRMAQGVAKGLLLGGWGAAINDQPLSASVLKKEHRHWASEIRLSQPIAVYENVDKESRLVIEWPASLVAHYQSKFMQGYALNRAHLEIPTSAILGLNDTVRTRILTFALEIQSSLSENDIDSVENLPPALVEKVFQITIMGGNNVIGNVGHMDALTVNVGDFEALKSALKATGLTENDVNELRTSLEKDGKAGEGEIGTETKSWLMSAVKKLGGKAVEISGSVAEEVLKAYIKGYLGQS